jgi:hypothetical protein
MKRRDVDLQAMLPLLRAIQEEIDERSGAVARLEQRLDAFAATPRIHAGEIALLRSDLSTQRRELRRLAKELAGLGVDFDPESPRAILAVCRAGGERGGGLDRTGFRRRVASGSE